LENAFASIRVNADPDSNVTDESDMQEEKHFSQRTSTLEGTNRECMEHPANAPGRFESMQTLARRRAMKALAMSEVNDMHLQKALASIRVRFEHKLSEERLHSQKQFAPMISTSRGRSTAVGKPKCRKTQIPEESSRKKS
jgi:hypothetical protein